MDNKQNNNSQRVKRLKVIKADSDYYPNHYKTYYDQKLKNDPDYEYGYNEFLYELFHAIDELGPIIPIYLKNQWTHFETDSNWGELKENNKIIFGDNFDESNSSQEMDFDEFLKIYNEYKKLCKCEPDEIIFKRLGDEISMEGIWYTIDDTTLPHENQAFN